MKNKISLLLIGFLFVISCSEDFITKDFDKARYNPETFYSTKSQALLGVNASYSALSNTNCWAQIAAIMPNAMSDDFYGTGFIAGAGGWGAIADMRPVATHNEVSQLWNGFYQGILSCNVALENIPKVKALDVTFTDDLKNSYMGQVYFLRALYYYNLFTYFPENRLPLIRTAPKSEADYARAPAPADSIFTFIETDLKKAQALLVKGLNNTAGYDKGRATRGAATALLGKLYLYKEKYQLAADQFKLILPVVGDATYGSYSLMPSYRDNFTNAKENNSESVFEIQFANVNGATGKGGDGASQNETNNYMQQWSVNRTTWSVVFWNHAIPKFRLNEFESWTETVAGVPTTVYDYRAYETFWGIQNGANFTNGANVLNWIQQGFNKEKIIQSETGVFGLRKQSYDASSELPGGLTNHSDINYRLIRVSDIMLLYAECMAKLNPSNVTPTDVTSAVYWVDQVRTRANKVMTDQAHLYSARAGVLGQLPTATALMATKKYTLDQLIRHERYVELYGEGTRFLDLKRWKLGPEAVLYKSGWAGSQTLTLPVPQTEVDNNPKNK